MDSASINKHSVGRIAERIVSNELEYRGFRVSDLNKESTSANADLLAAKDGKTWQIQVKGSTFDRGPWFSYGYCNEKMIAEKECCLFNKSAHFYRAGIVALVCVERPDRYSCLVLPTEEAEKAAEINFEREYLSLRKNGALKKPGPVFVCPEYFPATASEQRRNSWQREVAILDRYKNGWNLEEMEGAIAHDVRAASVFSSKSVQD